jgi:hypothetical protein
LAVVKEEDGRQKVEDGRQKGDLGVKQPMRNEIEEAEIGQTKKYGDKSAGPEGIIEKYLE